ncbi:uncharacterized protein LOC141649538 [Silene latifolia]|uniref:uncharacterized protein LOC141649538 n=1 Tax=Silene latifolia TaxID=37657 RepID=UPI003D787D09
MRQRRWIELVSRYDMEIFNHEGKENVIANTMSKKRVHALCMAMSSVKSREEVEMKGIFVIKKGDTISNLTTESELYAEIWEKQLLDSWVAMWRASVEEDKPSRFTIHEDGSLRFDRRWCVPDDEELKRDIFTEAHNTAYYVHPRWRQTVE